MGKTPAPIYAGGIGGKTPNPAIYNNDNIY